MEACSNGKSSTNNRSWSLLVESNVCIECCCGPDVMWKGKLLRQQEVAQAHKTVFTDP